MRDLQIKDRVRLLSSLSTGEIFSLGEPFRTAITPGTVIYSQASLISTVQDQLSEHNGGHTIRSDNQGVQIDEETRNSLPTGYQVGDN